MYTGQFLGGPYDKAVVTAKVAHIPVVMRVEIALTGDPAKPTILQITGEYVWQVKGQFYLWNTINKNSLGLKEARK
jgi:hypothetical protein